MLEVMVMDLIICFMWRFYGFKPCLAAISLTVGSQASTFSTPKRWPQQAYQIWRGAAGLIYDTVN